MEPVTRPVVGIDTLSVRELRGTARGRQTMKALGLPSVETTRDRRVRYDKPVPGKSAVGPFIGWDGEGITRNHKHRYVLLCNSEGDSLYNPRGLNTVQTLDWLCDVARDHKQANHVMFGGSYDANMILEGLGFYQASELANRGVLYVSKFRIEYRPRKFLRITRYRPGSRPLHENQTGSITLWDTIGFFQTSFVNALTGWLPDADDLPMITDMKTRRSSFTDEQIDDIRAYCISECRLLVELMSTMRDYMREVDCVPHRWDGAGAIASILLQRHKVKQYKTDYRLTTSGFEGNLPQEVNQAAQHAYFGGRIELVRFGNHDRRTFAHDIVSAYPYAMRDLPCLAHGTWRLFTGTAAELLHSPFALWHVRFTADRTDEPFYPLPWRSDKGLVYFPPTCEGWYWTPEYELLRDFYPNNHVVHEAWVFVPNCAHQPFGFIGPVFDYRKRLKESGHMGATVLKLGLNSLYGKLAQQVGWRRTQEGVKPPSYHCLEWAGMITSMTRARLFRLAMRDPEAVIAFETDGLYSARQHTQDIGSDFGAWELTEYDGVTYVQSGVYWTCTDGQWAPKYRGLDPPAPDDPDGFTRDRVLAGWSRGESELPIRQTRFRGIMTSCVSQERFCEWRQWVTDERSIELAPNGKRVHSTADCPTCRTGGVLHRTMATGGGTMSTAHGLAWTGTGVKTLVGDEYYRAAMALDEADEDA